MPEQLSGVIERITFHNLDNGYCVLRVQARGHRDLVTVVGHAQQVIAGEYVTATGDWVTDRTHGLQFKADEIKTTPPHTAEGIAKYLGSGLVKGIGPRYAKRIVEVFGENTLEVIDKSPTFLSQVKGHRPEADREDPRELAAAEGRAVDHGVPAQLRHRHRAGRPHLQDLRRERHRDGQGEPVPPQHRHLGRRVSPPPTNWL